MELETLFSQNVASLFLLLLRRLSMLVRGEGVGDTLASFSSRMWQPLSVLLQLECLRKGWRGLWVTAVEAGLCPAPAPGLLQGGGVSPAAVYSRLSLLAALCCLSWSYSLGWASPHSAAFPSQ